MKLTARKAHYSSVVGQSVTLHNEHGVVVAQLSILLAGSKDRQIEFADAIVAAFADKGFDLVAHLHRQRAFSERTFGPGSRLKGVIDHIRKELVEIEDQPQDIEEWADLLLLALDGAWRQGHTPEAICAAVEAKQTKNEGRKWPDWRTAPADKAIEHDRTGEA